MVSHLKRSIAIFSVIIFITNLLISSAGAQSGRGRPKVTPPANPANETPTVVNVPAAAAVTKQEQFGTSSRFVLRNGITVLISEHHSTPLAAVVARFKAGTLDEPWSISPASRLVERTILKGTILRPGTRALADLRALGASIESTTAYDGAEYSMIVPSDKLKEALQVQSDILQNPAFDSETVRREVQAFGEQRKQNRGTLDSGATVSSDAFSTRTFQSHRNDEIVTRMGEPSAVTNQRLFGIAFGEGITAGPDSPSITREQLLDFYRSHYRPDNLVISIAGDVSTFNTLVAVQQLFGPFGARPEKAAAVEAKSKEVAKAKPGPRATPAITTPPAAPSPPSVTPTEQPPTAKPWGAAEQTKLRYAADRLEVSEPIVSVGFHVPGADSKDTLALEVLTAMAGIGRASNLNRSLVDGQMVANRVESNYIAFSGTGFFVTQMWTARGPREGSSIDKAESALFKELDRLRRETPGEAELARAKSVLEKRFYDQSSLYLGRARLLADSEAAGVPFRASLDYRGRIQSVKADDVRRVAAKYLQAGNASIYEALPVSDEARSFDADSFAATVNAWVPGFAQPVESATVKAADPNSSPVPQGAERSAERQAMLESVQPLPVKDYSTLNGPRAFVREDHSQPTVTVAIMFQGGRLIEDENTSGTTELMLRTMLCGSPRRNLAQVAMELEQLGADVRMVVDDDDFGFVLSVLSRNADRALRIIRDLVEEPAFRDDDMARARLGQLVAIRDARDSAYSRSRELFFQALLPAHSYSLPPHGREEVVAALTPEKLREWYNRLVSRQLPLVVIVGDTDGSALVSSHIAEGFKRRELDNAIQVKTSQPTAAEKAETRRSGETFLTIGATGPKAGNVDVIAARVLESAMIGEGGRLLQELRDKQSLISAGSFHVESMFLGGAIYAYVVTPPENEQRLRTALRGEFEQVGRAGLKADEVASGRSLAISLRMAQLQSQPTHALEYARAVFYRQQAAEVDSFAEQAAKVTAEDIKRLGVYFKQMSVGVLRGGSAAATSLSPKGN